MTSVLPPALSALERYKQFILWAPITRESGKVDKVPVSPAGYNIDPHDPAAWMPADVALAEARARGLGLGFVFTADDPFFFLDIDKCLGADGWSPLAHSMIAALPGAAVEVSQSGTGLHVIGSGVTPRHSCKNVTLGLELYTEKRFVALTGDRTSGDAAADMSAHLVGLVAHYFPPDSGSAGSDVAEGWTTEPVAAWRGPDDDGELLRRALRSKSASSVFGDRASFADLWSGNEVALRIAFPPVGEGDYDASSADAALAQHLAFWTGSNCDRMFSLMWRSGLVREKWDRADYLPRTILGAASRQTQFYQEREPIERATPPMLVSGPVIVSGYQYLGADAQIEHFAGCVYIQDRHRIFTPSGALLKPDQFNATYGGYVFQLDDTGAKTTRKAWEAFTESQIVKHPRAASMCFRPELPTGAVIEEEGAKKVNVYVEVVTPRVPGDAGPFLRHLEKLLPVGTDRIILLSYLAACVQHKGVKFQWAPLIQGTPGNGKTLFTRCVAAAIGQKYTHLPSARDIDNKFNAWISQRLFIGVEDIYVPEHRGEVLEALKPLITNDRIEIQAKGSDQVTGDNRANFILNANLRDAIRKTRGDRRFAMFFTAQQDVSDLERDGLTGDYFPRLYHWLKEQNGYAIVTDFLYNYVIPSRYNPATECHRAPATSSTEVAIVESMGSVEQEILEAIDEGRYGFAGGWVSSMALDRLLQELRMTRAIPRNKRREVLQDLGYDWHPGLPGGRTSTHIMEDAGKPRLFIRVGHPNRGLSRQADIIAAYLADQKRQPESDSVDALIASV